MDWLLARNIAIMVNMGLAGKGNFPKPQELYSGIWTEDEIQAEQDAISVSNFLNFAKLHNSKIKERDNK